MKPGFDFVKQLEAQVSQCDAVLAIIGGNWFDARDDKGQRRLDTAHDYVRVELAAALTRDIPVIPVLLDGAVMPPEDALPDDLKSLARRHAMELRYTRFNSDAEELELALRDLLPRRWPKWLLPALGGVAAVAVIAALVAWRVFSPPDGGTGTAKLNSVVAPAVIPRPANQDVVRPQRNAVTPPAVAPRAPESIAVSGSFLVTLGDSMDRVKSQYRITAEPFTSGKSLGLRLPLSGIYFFFTEADKTLDNIRVDAPFEGSVEGVHIGDPVSGILSRLGEPYTTPWDFGNNKAYAYRIGGRIVRFDVDPAGKVATIFQFRP